MKRFAKGDVVTHMLHGKGVVVGERREVSLVLVNFPGELVSVHPESLTLDPESAADKYTATYWQDEADLPDGRPGVYYISINDPDGEEYATIIHRTSKGLYPIGGQVANAKLERSLEICEALNARL